jgi:hypothetical protein
MEKGSAGQLMSSHCTRPRPGRFIVEIKRWNYLWDIIVEKESSHVHVRAIAVVTVPSTDA